MNLAPARRALLSAAQRMSAEGLSRGTSGNLSVRLARGFLITPSGMAYDAMRPSDLVACAPDGTPRGTRTPSSEWRLHRDVYAAREDVVAIVHAHPTFATTLACLHRPIAAVHYQLATAGVPEVRCAPYATFGTEALSRVTVETLGAANACLMANHGLIAVGGSLEEALKVARDVEWVAELTCRAGSLGRPKVLARAELEQVIEKFATYGQPRGRKKVR